MWAIASFFFGSFTIAKVVALVAISISLTATFILTIEAAANSLAIALPPDVVAFAVAVLPQNLSACISVIAVARIGRWVYDWHITIAKSLTS